MLKVYAYENSCGNKGIIIAEKKEKGVLILKKKVRIETGMTFCKCVCTYQAYTSDTRRIPSMQTEVMEDNEEGTFS